MKEIEKYIKKFPPEAKKKVLQLREIIQKAAPKTTEEVEHGAIAVKSKEEYIVWYSCSRRKVSLFPKATTIEKFKEDLKDYKITKGTIEFPLEEALPVDLISKIVKYRIKETIK